MKPFVNFHAHSIGSMLDGNCKPKKYIQRAKEIEMPAVVFTDHGNMFTSMDAYNEANDAGVKYFFGQEFYQARKTRWDRDPEERASGSGANEWGQKGPYHLGIVAYNNVGYHNLAKLSSKAYLDGYYVKPRIDHELLAQHSEGLVCLSGCLSSEIQQALLRDDFDFAYKTACEFQEIFGRENFFIEVQDHHIPEQQKTNPLLIDLAHKIGALVVPTCDCHYVYREDAADHDILLCISTASNINDEGRFKFANDQFYLKSYEEMCELFPKEIVENTMAIYEKHDIKLDFGEYHFPVFEPPQGKDVTSFFEETVELGSHIRFGNSVPQEVKDRLDYEIKVIKDMGFPNYFMVITDIVNWAKKQGIMMGPGRGSVTGSLVAYCLKITEVNPLQFNLLFERFLVPGRISMPDVDIDIDDRYRDKVIDYARDKYGHEYTAKICNFSQIKAKNAVKDVARVLGYPYAKGDEISKAMPPDLFGKSKSLDECLETEQFRNLYENDPDVKIIVDKAKGIEGSYRQTGIHAAGLIMADKPVMEYVPLMREGENEPVKTQFDMHIIDLCKLLKFDFLSLRNLNIIDICLKEIKRMRGKDIGSVWKLSLDDKPTYEALSKGLNVGAFQLESEGIRDLAIRLKPSTFTDIMAILALYRPGPMGSNVHIKYVERKWGREPVTYLHPSLEPILNETYGLLLYQEQLIRIAQRVAGFTISEADDMRKVVGKKLTDKMPLFREKFTQGCINTVGMNELIAGRLFDEIAHHADYSFSSNHACAYGMITYVTAYLKTHYPAEFMAATLSTVQDNKERLRMYLQACRSMNISVRPPSINKSLMDFSVLDNNEILYGLNAIRGLGDVAVKTLVDCRSEPYETIYDFFRRADPGLFNSKTLKSLGLAGALDELLTENPSHFTRSDRLGILINEAEQLGLYISDHPLDDLHDIIEGKITHKVSDLGNAMGKKVVIGGIVNSFDKRITRQGKKVYKIELEDTTGVTSVDIMGKMAAELEDDYCKHGDILIVSGKVAKSNDEDATIKLLYFNSEKVEIDKLDDYSPIYLSRVDPSRIDELNKLVENNKGMTPVYVLCNAGGRIVRVRLNTKVKEEIEPQLRELELI